MLACEKMKSFTLIETLIAIAVFTIAMGAVAGAIVMIYRVYGYNWQQALAIEEARRGIEVIVKEIRQARTGDDGSYPIEIADDKEFVFYSDIDHDNQTERVRYFLGSVSSGSLTQKCVTQLRGGSCSVTFSNFLRGTLISAELKVSVEGDLGASNEFVEIFVDGIKLGNLCQSGCTDCAGTWQGTTVFDVTSQAGDNSIQFVADATSRVDPFCQWEEPNHSLKAQFEFSWTENLEGQSHEFKRGVIKSVVGQGGKITYPQNQEEVSILSSYVRNTPPIFKYFDQNGNELIELPARLKDTKVMEVYLVVNVDPNRPPNDFELKSTVQIRNLKE